MDAGGAEGAERGRDVLPEALREAIDVRRPGFWDVLLLRVGPGVGEVVVEVDAVAFGLEASGELEGVGEVVRGALSLVVSWIYPESR